MYLLYLSFPEGADELLADKIHKLAESQDFTQDFVRHLIRFLTIAVPVTSLVDQQAKIAVASEMNFRQDIIRELSVKKKVTPPSLMTSGSPVSLGTSKDDKKDNENKNFSSNHLSKPSSCSKCGSSRHSDDSKGDKFNQEPKRLQVLKLVNAHFTASLRFRNVSTANAIRRAQEPYVRQDIQIG